MHATAQGLSANLQSIGGRCPPLGRMMLAGGLARQPLSEQWVMVAMGRHRALTTSVPRAEDSPRGPRVVGLSDGLTIDLGSVGARFMARSEESGGFALVEHPIPPRTLAAPLHRHAHEDE